MRSENILIHEREDPALEELYASIRHFHGRTVPAEVIREIISGLYHRQEISRLLFNYTMISYRNLTLDRVESEKSYQVFDRSVGLAKLHLQVLHYFRQRKKALKAFLDAADIEYMLQARDLSDEESSVNGVPSRAELEFVARRLQGYLQDPVELNIETIEKIFLLIDEAQVEYFLLDT